MTHVNIETNQEEEEAVDMNLLAYRMRKAEEAIREGFKEQAHQIQQLTTGFVSKALYDEAKKDAKEEHIRLQAQINGIVSNITWLVRTIVGALVLAAIAAVIAL